MSPDNKKLKVFAVAGEESANQYLKKIISSFEGKADFSGIAFSNLEDQVDIVYPAENLAVMGFIEVFFKWRKISKAFKKSIAHIIKTKPDVVLLIDFGGFNLKLAKKIKEASPETKIHYFISPKIWAWGHKRALKVKKYIDEMYVIHPFEVDFYKDWSVESKFVGHPLIQSLNEKYFSKEWQDLEKKKLGLSGEKIIFGVLLGSRVSEITRHKEKFCKIAKKLQQNFSNLEVAFIVPPSKSIDEFKDYLRDEDLSSYLLLQDDEPMSRIAICDLCLVASGTATLQVALLHKPMAIAYMMNPITMWLARKFVTGIKHAGLVNILHQREMIPEFLQEEIKVDALYSYFEKLIKDQEFKAKQIEDLKTTRKLLTEKNTYEVLRDEIIASR